MDQENCKGCVNADQCRQVWAESPKGTISPAGLSLGSMLAFIFPLLTAIIAGAIVRVYLLDTKNSTYWEIAAAVGGLCAGAALARLFMSLLRKRFDEPKP